MTQSIEKSLLQNFQEYFGESDQPVRLFFAPGRVNLIGEHTDYNGGYVFPAAITLGTYMAVRKRNDSKYVMKSDNFPGNQVEIDQSLIVNDPNDDWGNYPKGIIKELLELGVPLAGADLLYHGNLPNGAGLSSSASIGMVTAYGLSQLVDFSISTKELAFLCQRMENRFIGVNTGIMDQTAVGFGKANQAILLNCKSFELEMIPLNLGDYKIVITNTNKRRGLADSKYNERRQECEKGLAELQQVKAGLTCLGDLSLELFEELEGTIKEPLIKKRVRHVVTEDNRVLLAAQYLKEDQLEAFGQLMIASHLSLRDDYEVTGAELDALFESQKAAPGCIGTRMTGAGFGGCTVSLVNSNQLDAFEQQVQEAYFNRTGLTPTFYMCEAGPGVLELEKQSN
ncbi:galactokinase [Pullulanibacillus sp. KACC 23026]|uniref:galactokinase n=1 Tax=Pullulanibacillus sp. KACC 23026 TaxID=3028315 RepID=UPI0023B10705|nr:galactokinase [Pullulanibacillus sp. KACC 23026]WEG12904.1 galactokinase [Pullulanibacillus sp. KACC 23026]